MTTTTLTLPGRSWRALATHAATEKTRYAMEGAALCATPEKAKAWGLTSPTVLCSTDGKAALLLAHDGPAPSELLLVLPPKVAKTKAATNGEHVGATIPNGTGGHYPPIDEDTGIFPPTSEHAAELDVDGLRGLFLIGRDDDDACRFTVGGRGAKVVVRDAIHDVTRSAELGAFVDSGEAPCVGLNARLVRRVLDAAELLGVTLVTVSVVDERKAVVFSFGARGLALVMPVVLPK